MGILASIMVYVRFVSLCGVIEEEGMLHLFGAQVFLKGRAMFRVMKGAQRAAAHTDFTHSPWRG